MRRLRAATTLAAAALISGLVAAALMMGLNADGESPEARLRNKAALVRERATGHKRRTVCWRKSIDTSDRPRLPSKPPATTRPDTEA